MPNCTVSDDNKCSITNDILLKANNYCISDNKVIYKGANDSSDGSCEIAYGNGSTTTDDGILVFDVTIENEASLIDLTNSTPLLEIPTFVLYDCSYGECIQTYGYVKYNNKIYQCNSVSSIEFKSISSCNQNTIGQVQYNLDDSSPSFKICVFEKTIFSEDGEEPSLSYTLKNIEDSNYYLIRSNSNNNMGIFAGDFEYYNIGLIKTKNNIAAFSMKSKNI